MSGPQEQWDKLDSSDQLDPRDATLDLSRLIERFRAQSTGEVSGSATRTSRDGIGDRGTGSGSAGNGSPGNRSGAHFGGSAGNGSGGYSDTTPGNGSGAQLGSVAPDRSAPALYRATEAAVTRAAGPGSRPTDHATDLDSALRVGFSDKPDPGGIRRDADPLAARTAERAASLPDAYQAIRAPVGHGADRQSAPKLDQMSEEAAPEEAAVSGGRGAQATQSGQASRQPAPPRLGEPAKPAQPAAPAQLPEPVQLPEPALPALPGQPQASQEAEPGSEASADGQPRDAGYDNQAAPPVTGSLADLRRRLELLPFGHPSSPYHVDGERKPPPPRLRHLELAPPAPTRTVHLDTATSPADWPNPADDHSGTESGGDESGGRIDGGLSSFEPYGFEPSRFESRSAHERVPPADPEPTSFESDAGQSAGQQPSHREPEDQASVRAGSAGADPYASAQAPRTAPYSSQAEGHGNSNGSTLPPAAPRTAADGSWNWGHARLTPDQVRAAEDAYDRFRMAEGRNLFGSYVSGGLTTMLRGVEATLEHGQLAPDTEQQALLEPDSFKRRFAELIRRHPDRTSEQLARRVPGALTYSFVFDTDRYAAGTWLVQEALESRGFRLLARRNGWNGAENRWVVTIWHDALHELPFQVQFHTSASLEAQQLARTSADLINDPRIPASEAANLRSDLAAVWAALPAPPGNIQIGDYRAGRSSGHGRP
ncbi:MAG TPA: hypothetical protein VNF47_01045 [Streptosporangiaceae bacterium]|nr:hypothetical protein [Streptosporangiaceae bacterium]